MRLSYIWLPQDVSGVGAARHPPQSQDHPGITLPMSRRGNCYDNTMVEYSLKTLDRKISIDRMFGPFDGRLCLEPKSCA